MPNNFPHEEFVMHKLPIFIMLGLLLFRRRRHLSVYSFIWLSSFANFTQGFINEWCLIICVTGKVCVLRYRKHVTCEAIE